MCVLLATANVATHLLTHTLTRPTHPSTRLCSNQAAGLQVGQLPRPDQVVGWLSQVNTEDALDVARLLQPGSPTGRQLTGFAQEVVRGLAERAAPRIERAVGAAGRFPFAAGTANAEAVSGQAKK